jgi:hypothetical protein
MPALSIITVQEIIDEMEANEQFATLTADEQLELINSSQQEVCDSYIANGRDDYRSSNLTLPLIAGVNLANLRIGSGFASIAGTPIVFTVSGSPAPLDTATPKILMSNGVTYINPVGDVDTRTANGFTAFAMADDVPFDYVGGDIT